MSTWREKRAELLHSICQEFEELTGEMRSEEAVAQLVETYNGAELPEGHTLKLSGSTFYRGYARWRKCRDRSAFLTRHTVRDDGTSEVAAFAVGFFAFKEGCHVSEAYHLLARRLHIPCSLDDLKRKIDVDLIGELTDDAAAWRAVSSGRRNVGAAAVIAAALIRRNVPHNGPAVSGPERPENAPEPQPAPGHWPGGNNQNAETATVNAERSCKGGHAHG